MITSHRILRSSIATLAAVAFTAPLLHAATLDTFETGDPNTLSIARQIGEGLGPTIVEEGGNHFLRLLHGVNSENNLYSYDLSDAGAFETITATFDFRVGTGTGGLADGIGLLLLPTSVHGTVGSGPTPTAEEPNVAGAFGLGIDVYDQINNVSTHWNGFQVGEMNPAPNVSFRDNGVFNRVQVQLQRVGNATNAVVTMIPDSLGAVPGTPYKIMETVMPNMLPYESRLQFGGRTGGQNMKVDLDNINVSYANSYIGGLPVAPTGHLYQDFDSVGSTGYRAVQLANTDPTTFRPGPLIKAGDASTDGAFLRIVNDNVGGQNNRIVFDRAFDGGASTLPEVLEFDLRFNSSDTPADGLGLLFLPTIDPATGIAAIAGDGIGSSEEPMHGGMLGIGFDVYPNGAPDVAPGVSLHFDNVKLADVPLPAEIGLGQFHKVQVVREAVEGGLNVSVIAFPDVNGVAGAPVTLLEDIFVAGARNHDYRVQLSGRTGGANADHDVDNIRSFQLAGTAKSHTHANFSTGAQSGWKAYTHGAGAPPQIKNDFEPNEDYIRLLHDGNNSQLNSVAFDKQLDGVVAGANGINAEFDFRISGADQPADGFSFMLIPTGTYGDTGPGAASTPGFVAEEPNLAGVFALGFDLYNGGGIEFNELSAHWNGFAISNRELINDLALDLDFGAYHHVRLELRPSGADMLLDLILTPDTFGTFGAPGTPLVVFDDLVLPGMGLYDYRVEFAGRTGGLNMSLDVDNILAQTVPEPSSAALLAMGGVLAAGFRRRRAARN